VSNGTESEKWDSNEVMVRVVAMETVMKTVMKTVMVTVVLRAESSLSSSAQNLANINLRLIWRLPKS